MVILIEFISNWAKGLTMAVIIISILEMILPNNKTKKYVRMIMGVFLLFTIISPFIQNDIKQELSVANLEDLFSNQTQIESKDEINQTSMNERIEELYIQELEKDIKNKMNEKGYEIEKIKIDVNIADEQSETKINKIKLKLQKMQESEKTTTKNDSLENKIVTQVEKIKEIDTSIKKNEEKNYNNSKEQSNLTSADLQNIKNFLKEEYGVDEKCLEIN